MTAGHLCQDFITVFLVRCSPLWRAGHQKHPLRKALAPLKKGKRPMVSRVAAGKWAYIALHVTRAVTREFCSVIKLQRFTGEKTLPPPENIQFCHKLVLQLLMNGCAFAQYVKLGWYPFMNSMRKLLLVLLLTLSFEDKDRSHVQLAA